MSGAELAVWGDGGAGLTLALAFALGLRHATDPDHVAAVATLAADPREGGAVAAGRLGLAWGLGHAATCTALGLAAVWAGAALPSTARIVAELGVGLLLVALATRLLLRAWRGRIHVHPHRHGALVHAHAHLHEPVAEPHTDAAHAHGHRGGLGRSPAEAFGIGLVHGVGGSALAAALVVAAVGDAGRALLFLACFAAGSVLAMTGASAGLGLAFARAPRALRLERVAPLLAVATLAFGAWYAAVAASRLVAPA